MDATVTSSRQPAGSCPAGVDSHSLSASWMRGQLPLCRTLPTGISGRQEELHPNETNRHRPMQVAVPHAA